MTGRISPAAWSALLDSTQRCAPVGTTCKARGPPEQGGRRPWRAAASRARSGARVAGAASLTRNRAPPLRGGHGAHEKRKRGRRSRASHGGVRCGRAPTSDSAEEKHAIGPHLRSNRVASWSAAWCTRWRCYGRGGGFNGEPWWPGELVGKARRAVAMAGTLCCCRCCWAQPWVPVMDAGAGAGAGRGAWGGKRTCGSGAGVGAAYGRRISEPVCNTPIL